MERDISWSEIRTKSPPKKRQGSKRKKRKPKGGYVYLFERISFRSIKAILTGQREIKIGITERDTDERLKEVDSAILGKVIKIHEQRYDYPRREEKRLHAIFKSSKFKPKAIKKGGGTSEWFLMSKSEFRQLKNEFDVSGGWYFQSFVWGTTLILLYFAYLFLRVYVINTYA